MARKNQRVENQLIEQKKLVEKLLLFNGIPILVVGATGKQGSQVCKFLLEKGFKVFGTTRNELNLSLTQKGVIPIQFKFGDPTSISSALQISNAKHVYFMTDLMMIAGGKKEVEIQHGKVIVDACRAASVRHVVFSSVADCDKCPENVTHFKTKVVIEDYLKSSGLPFTILRPVAFLENFTDPTMAGNPFKTGVLKCFWRRDLKVKLVSCVDIGRAAAIAFSSPEKWISRTIDCVSCDASAEDILPILTSLATSSKIPMKKTSFTCAMAVPSFVIRYLLADMQYMIDFFEATGYSSNIEAFKEIVPVPMGLREFFEQEMQRV